MAVLCVEESSADERLIAHIWMSHVTHTQENLDEFHVTAALCITRLKTDEILIARIEMGHVWHACIREPRTLGPRGIPLERCCVY